MNSYKEAYIVHPFTNCGGGEKLSLEAARALHEYGINVIYFTNSRDVLNKCREMLGVPVEYRVVEVNSSIEQLLGLTRRLVRVRRLLLLNKIYEKLKDLEGRGLVIDMRSDYPSKAHAIYIHYPLLLGIQRITGKGSFHRKTYSWLVRKLAESIRGTPALVMSNSMWTAKIVREIYKVEPVVIYPPVDVDYFGYNGEKKDKIIVTVSRLTSEKNLHLLPRVASKLPDYAWYIVGSMGTGMERYVSRATLDKIQNEAKRYKADNIQVLPDLPRSELKNLLLEASFYVHPYFPEHFGIAVAEAMAAGAIPIVYKDGGAWSDIVSPVSEKLGYDGVEEIPQIVRSIEENKSLANILRERAIARVREFRPEIFRKRFIEALRQTSLI